MFHLHCRNVIEKCLQYGTQPQRDVIVEEILRAPTQGPTALEMLMKDQYANYVVQRMLEIVRLAPRRPSVLVIFCCGLYCLSSSTVRVPCPNGN